MSDLRQDAMAVAPAAGWYPDPADTARSRWWDGESWTDHIQPAAVAAVPPGAVTPVVSMTPGAAIPSPNLDGDGVPLTLFADSAFHPAALAPAAGPSSQEDWHNHVGRGSKVRRQVAGSVSLSTAGASAKRISDPYERNWIAGLAIVLAVLSIPVLFLRSAWDLPPLTQSMLAGAPIAISLLALATAIRRGGRIALPLVATVIAALVVVAGFLVEPAVLSGVVDTVAGLLPA